jgi:hypothetical protein
MKEESVKNGLNPKFLLGLALMLSVTIALVVFARKMLSLLPQLGFSPFETLLVIAGECAMSAAIIYLLAAWVEKSAEKSAALTKKDVLVYTIVQALIIIKILILATAKWWLYG